MKKKQIISAIFLLFFAIAGLFCPNGNICKAATEETDEIGAVADIGSYQDEEGGYSNVGVQIRVNSVLHYFAFDTWKKSNGTWSYVGSNISGKKGTYNSYMYNANPIWLRSPKDTDNRFMIFGNKVRALSDCSVVLRKYRYGQLISTSVEYSFSPDTQSAMGNLSLFQTELQIGTYGADGITYCYDVQGPIEIKNAQVVISANPMGGTLEEPGIAYKTYDGYYIRTFPTVSKVKTGCKTTFLGWYTAEEGGKKINTGTVFPKSTCLYAHWKEEMLSYPVTCIDILGEDESGEVLGKSTWKQEYGTQVSGAMAGCDSKESVYYSGCTYIGCSQTITGISGTTVYRYFKPTKYTILFHGNGATSGSMMCIAGCSYEEDIPLTKNCFQKENRVRLHANGENAVCDTSELYVTQEFQGWSLEPDGGVRYSDGAMCKSSEGQGRYLDLYAVWNEKKTTVNNIPVRMGYQFAGWSLQADADTGYTQFCVSSDIDLYAVWKPAATTYRVECYKENVSGAYDLVSSYERDGYTDSEVAFDASEESYKGFRLDEKSSMLSGKVRADGSLVLTAYFQRCAYDFSYDMNGGTPVGQLPAQDGIKKKFGITFSLTDVQGKRDGYTFGGWSEEADGSGKVYQSGEVFTMQNHDVVLYAVWIPVSGQIRFEANADSEEIEGTMKAETAGYMKETALPECAYIRKGYEFDCWNTMPDGSGISYLPGQLYQNLSKEENSVMILYAQWTPVHFTITYDKNETEEIKSIIGGVIPDTGYYYDKDCYASKMTYQAMGYTVKCWNTKADGSGIDINPGENMKGKLISYDESTLYAIWEPNENTAFTVQLFLSENRQNDGKVTDVNTKEGMSDSMTAEDVAETEEDEDIIEEKLLDTLVLYGKTEERLCDAIERIYESSLEGEEAAYFYEGYVITNPEVLEERIKGDSSTNIALYVMPRQCTVSFEICKNNQFTSVVQKEVTGLENIILPEKINGISVSGYEDGNGQEYEPGSEVTVKKNMTFYLQHKVVWQGNADEFTERTEHKIHGKEFRLPAMKKKGYQFLGWYSKDGNYIGTEGDYVSGITEDVSYVAKWSEPLSYQISYDIDDLKIKILEQTAQKYCYGQTVALPNSNQIWVNDDYRFVGWYDSDDAEQKIITQIEKGECGNKKIKALLIQKEKQQPDNVTDQQNSGNSINQIPVTGNKNTGQQTETKQADQTKSTVREETGKISSYTARVTCFWKNNLKYRVTSQNGGKQTVKIIDEKINKKTFVIPGTVTYKGVKYYVTGIGKKAFYKNKKIKTLTISNTVRHIEVMAFSKMKKLQKVTIGKEVCRIDAKGFANNPKLQKVIIRSSKVKKAGKQIFTKAHKKVKFYGKRKTIKKLQLQK